MHRNEIIEFIRDQMLTSPYLEAHFIYRLSFLSETDDRLFTLMNAWMELEDLGERINIETIMQEIVKGKDFYGSFIG